MTGAALRVAIADDSALIREGVARVLSDAGLVVVAQVANAVELMAAIASHDPQVVVVDIRMPPTHTDEGVRAARRIREGHPGVGVVVLSQHAEPEYALELLADGTEGIGYLLKDRIADIDEFAAAVRRVAAGGSALDPSIVGLLVARKRRASPLEVLSPREREVLSLMAEGRSNQAIADRLVVTPRAVEKHITSIFEKLDLGTDVEDHRRVLAVLTFLRAADCARVGSSPAFPVLRSGAWNPPAEPVGFVAGPRTGHQPASRACFLPGLFLAPTCRRTSDSGH